MPRADYAYCKDCGRHASECGGLSHNRLCLDCGLRRRNENHAQLLDAQGPWYDHWVYRGELAYRRRRVALQRAKG